MTKKQRAEVLDKTNGRCGYCGCELNGKFQVDHMSPLIRYTDRVRAHWRHKVTAATLDWFSFNSICIGRGNTEVFDVNEWEEVKEKKTTHCHHPERDTPDNLIAACTSCNMNKSGSNVEQFRYTISNGVNSMNKTHAQYRMGKRFGLIVEIEKPVVFYFETIGIIPPVFED